MVGRGGVATRGCYREESDQDNIKYQYQATGSWKFSKGTNHHFDFVELYIFKSIKVENNYSKDRRRCVDARLETA